MARAAELAGGAPARRRSHVLATVFLTASMRTRVGFQVAAQRLGGTVVSVDELRVDATMSSAESYEDALRVISGMVDVVVSRTPFTLEPAWLAASRCPVVSGGDDHEHPTQALIDLAAIDKFHGDVRRLRVGLCGDLSMRSATSLLELLAHRPPAALTLIHPEGRGPLVPAALASIARRDELAAGATMDVLVMVGLAPRRGSSYLDDEARHPYVLTGDLVRTMPPDAIVLSPMPVIDEIAPEARRDQRVRIYEQSDHAVPVRMAILEWALEPDG